MHISVVTLFPDLYKPFLATSLIDKACQEGLISYAVQELFEYAAPKERIDGPTFGHGAGMVIRPEVIERAVTDLESKKGKAFKIFFSPRGKKLDQLLLKNIHQKIRTQGYEHMMLLPARYEGMDARIEQEYADEIISVGDFVLMGGDLPAMTFMESYLRLIPGVIGKQSSVEEDSFSGPFVDYPEFTAPVVWKDRQVPDVLRSGNHEALRLWRQETAVRDTVFNHFEWLRSYPVITAAQEQAVRKVLPAHYVVLMHSHVLLPDDKITGMPVVGTTSVTSLDIHDIARACATYGIKNYFIVTPLADQRTIVRTLLDFWQGGPGVTYNNHRHEAVSRVILDETLENVCAFIQEREQKAPILIATAARQGDDQDALITYHDQEKVWAHDRPVLLVLGTGRGLSPEIMQRCDYRLVPVEGYSSFNHLSVRSAAAIVLDRWLGKNRRNR